MSEENILNNYLVGRSILSFLINKHNKHGIFKTSDYDLNLKKRKAKYKGFKNILCEECNENIDKQGCYCVNCYKNETEIYKRNHMRYGLNFGIFKTLDYDLNLKERRKKYYDHDYILCEECNLEIDKRYYYCKHCYDRDAICTQNTFKVGIFKTSDYDLNLKERKVKYEDFRVILCEECGQEIYKHCYYCTICYKKHGINEKNHMKYGSNFGIFTVNNYLLLNWNERQVKFKCFDVVLCGKCNIKIDKLYYYCVRCFNHEAENHRKYNFKVGVFKTSDYDLNLKKRKAKYKDFKNILCEECDKKFDKECYYCIDCYKNEPECYKQNHMKYGLNFGIYKTLDYDLNLKERRKKFYDYDYILCEKCNQVIDKRKVKYDNYDQIICGECKQGIAKHYYYCLVCYNIKTDINEQSHMKYGLNFGIFKITDYDLNLEKRKTKYKNFKIILCEKCNQEIDNQYYCKNCFVKETNYSKKFRMKCVFKTGILETSDYDLNVKERQAKFESYDIIKCEKCNYEINNFYNYRCDECYSKADKYERKRMTFGICKYCSEINAECGCLYSLNQLLKEFKNFNESKVNGNAITMTISDYDLNEDDRRAKYKDYNHILCEKCNKMFTYNYCHDCVAEKKQKLKKLQTELQIYENFYNKLYDRITNKLKISEELQLIIRNNEYIYSKIKRFEGTYLQIKIVIEYIMSIKRELIRIKQVPEICFHNARSYCVCYNMETDINEKNRMEFGKCKECLRIHEDLNDKLSEYKKMPIRLSYNLNESNELQSHPQAIYKSRLLNFQNLPEPINCPNHQEFVSSRHIMKIQTGQVNTLHSDGCSDCIIDGTQV
ncbi:7904_t:CDS:2 [Rhizophagus irregularis]|nr:7904_t:CDS:2 [Rhizophagus irregularis]